eukprot:ANDGO_06423.mRNA.1 hypothetical protein H310_01027
MFAYLSKKIAIPNKTRLKCVAWNTNPDGGYIACGGEESLLKVLKLEAGALREGDAICTLAAPTTLTMNQSLPNHSNTVFSAVWNPVHSKLTTVDLSGMIIVWMLHKGQFAEEMVNHRDNATVASIAWSHQGDKICIVYDDGLVIVGSVDGNRIWGKPALSSQPTPLSPCKNALQWSPDGSRILVGTYSAGSRTELVSIDSTSAQVTSVSTLAALADVAADSFVSLQWSPATNFMVAAFSRGRVQIMRADAPPDEVPIIIDTKMTNTCACASPDGTLLAVGGYMKGGSSGKSEGHNMVQFYAVHSGRHVCSLKVPGTPALDSVSFDASGLRICMAVDGYLYFAHLRPAYKWGFCAPHTVVYSFLKQKRIETALMFWNAKSGEKHLKYVKHFKLMATHNDQALLCARTDDDQPAASNPPGNNTNTANSSPNAGPGAKEDHVLVLCNSIGAPLDSKRLVASGEPRAIGLALGAIACAFENHVLLWARNQAGSATVTAANVGSGQESSSSLFGKERVVKLDGSGDPICAMCVSDSCIWIGRESGVLLRYSLPLLQLDQKLIHKSRPHSLHLNCVGTKVLVLDVNGSLQLYEAYSSGSALSANSGSSSAPAGQSTPTLLTRLESFERKDVWSVVWATDHADRFACVEKSRLLIFNGTEPEDPLESSAHVCAFGNLKVKTVSIDDLVRFSNPETPIRETYCVLESKALRDTRTMLAAASTQFAGSGNKTESVSASASKPQDNSSTSLALSDAFAFVNQHSHPRLWKLLAEAALTQLDFSLAERAFVAYRDYAGLVFVRRVRRLRDPRLQKADVFTYFKRFDDADREYRKMDRSDLALDLRRRLGDWTAVIQALNSPGSASSFVGGDGMDAHGSVSSSVSDADVILKEAYQRYGEYFLERHQYAKAAPYFQQSGDLGKLALCYDRLDDFSAMEKMVETLPSCSPLAFGTKTATAAVGSSTEHAPVLVFLGKRLGAAGLSRRAMDAFVKAGDVKAAIDSCIALNEWERALQLAATTGYDGSSGTGKQQVNVEKLLSQYAAHLKTQGQIGQAIELFRKANRHVESAKMLQRLGLDELKVVGAKANLARVKKIFVLAALDMDHWKRVSLASTAVGNTASGSTSGAVSVSQRTTAAATAFLESLIQEDLDSASAGSASSGGRSKNSSEGSVARATVDSNAWHAAEGVHFYLLAERHLYEKRFVDAVRTALLLMAYEDVLPVFDVYALIAVTAYHARWYATCARAFLRLESIALLSSSAASASAVPIAAGSSGNAGSGAQEEWSHLFLDSTGVSLFSAGASSPIGGSGLLQSRSVGQTAVAIFSRHPPTDPPTADSDKKQISMFTGVNLLSATGASSDDSTFLTSVTDRPVPCVGTGRLLPGSAAVGGSAVWKCKACRHVMIEQEVAARVACPLCHSAIKTGSGR